MNRIYLAGFPPPPSNFHPTSYSPHIYQHYISFPSIPFHRHAQTGMMSRRLPPRAKTTPIQTLHSLLTVQEAENASRRRPPTGPFLLTYNSLPPWRQDNHFILTHYRPESYSYAKCFQSLFYLHNESVNIHSHLLGTFIFFFISLSLYVLERFGVKTGDVLAFGCFFVGAMSCLGISAGYHLISNHSPGVQSRTRNGPFSISDSRGSYY